MGSIISNECKECKCVKCNYYSIQTFECSCKIYFNNGFYEKHCRSCNKTVILTQIRII